jgi:hypothetical protein
MTGINTGLLHNYPVIDKYTGASSIPKYQTSTFSQTKLNDESRQFMYTRFGNPTVKALEEGMAYLFQSKYALAFSSGMAAISNVLMLAKTGRHIILPLEVYGGTCQFVSTILPRFGITASFVDMSSLADIEAHIQPNTCMIYIETPSNPLLKVTDIKAVCELAKKHKLLTVCDNTFMTPLYQRPFELGADVVLESATKFINGHSDVVAGVVATNDQKIYEQMYLYQKNFGGILGVEDAWLILRGMKTLGIRMEKSVYNAQKIAEFLETKKSVKKVYYPGLKSHVGHAIHMSQAANGGAVLSFVVDEKYDCDEFVSKVHIPILAVSLGGVESILSHPATMSHACLTPEERAKEGVTDNLFRLSCGIEDLSDLIDDLDRALK